MLYWEEENRLMVLKDNNGINRYTYNAAGERIMKSYGTMEGVYINGAPQGITFHETDNFTLYPASILSVNKNRFTKHYFLGDKRVASRIGTGLFNNVYGRNGSYVTAGQQDYAERMNQIQTQKEAYYKKVGVAPGVPTEKGAYGDPENTGVGYNAVLTELGNHDVPQGWIQTPRPNTTPNTNPGPPVSWNDPSNPDDPQAGYGYIPNDTTKEETFFYHSDHLGSTSYITDDHANITQYDAYLPYGELLVDEHSSREELPYKFNGKQFDEETGLYYYGARYMNPVTSLWYGVDPMAEKYMTIGAYVYCVSNPIRFLDLIGKEPGDFFESMDLAAIDFGKYYNASSIKENREYATLIYETKDRWGNIAYSYNTPLKGTQDSSKPSTDGLPKDAIVRAIAHTHGEDLVNYDNENFSPTDIETYKYFDGYVVTPKGKLKHYNHITEKQNIVATKRLPYSLKKGSNGRTKVIGNVYYHKKGFKTATERRVAWYKNKMKESWYDRHISSTLHPIEKVSKQ